MGLHPALAELRKLASAERSALESFIVKKEVTNGKPRQQARTEVQASASTGSDEPLWPHPKPKSK